MIKPENLFPLPQDKRIARVKSSKEQYQKFLDKVNNLKKDEQANFQYFCSMADNQKLHVDIIGDSSKLNQALGRAEGRLKKFSGSLSRTGRA